ncbi:unnamed protein product, partial [Pylaiella littoralis]
KTYHKRNPQRRLRNRQLQRIAYVLEPRCSIHQAATGPPKGFFACRDTRGTHARYSRLGEVFLGVDGKYEVGQVQVFFHTLRARLPHHSAHTLTPSLWGRF